MERVYLKLLTTSFKRLQQTSNVAMYGELGRVPLDIVRMEKSIKYWFKIVKAQDSLVGQMFNDKVNNNIRRSWAYNVQSLLNDLGFSYLWNDPNISNLQLKLIIERLHDQHYQQWYSDLDTSSK